MSVSPVEQHILKMRLSTKWLNKWVQKIPPEVLARSELTVLLFKV